MSPPSWDYGLLGIGVALAFTGFRLLRRRLGSSRFSQDANRVRYAIFGYSLLASFLVLLLHPATPFWLFNLGASLALLGIGFFLWGWLRPSPLEYHRSITRLATSLVILLLFLGLGRLAFVDSLLRGRAGMGGGWSSFFVLGLMILGFFPFHRALESWLNALFLGLKPDVVPALDSWVQKAASARGRLDLENDLAAFVLRTLGVSWCGVYEEGTGEFSLSTFQRSHGKIPVPPQGIGPTLESAVRGRGAVLVQDLSARDPLRSWMLESGIEGLVSCHGLAKPGILVAIGPRENRWTFARDEAAFFQTVAGLGGLLLARAASGS